MQTQQFFSEYFALFDPRAFSSPKDPQVCGCRFPSLCDTLDLSGEKTFQLVGLLHLHPFLRNVSGQHLLKCPSSMLLPILSSMQLDQLYSASLSQLEAYIYQQQFKSFPISTIRILQQVLDQNSHTVQPQMGD